MKKGNKRNAKLQKRLLVIKEFMKQQGLQKLFDLLSKRYEEAENFNEKKAMVEGTLTQMRNFIELTSEYIHRDLVITPDPLIKLVITSDVCKRAEVAGFTPAQSKDISFIWYKNIRLEYYSSTENILGLILTNMSSLHELYEFFDTASEQSLTGRNKRLHELVSKCFHINARMALDPNIPSDSVYIDSILANLHDEYEACKNLFSPLKAMEIVKELLTRMIG